MYSKIRNDTFRTLATDQEFLDKVGEEKLVRCLEAFVHRQIGEFPLSLSLCLSSTDSGKVTLL
jgi:cell cycle arrest protein BUB2